MNINAHGHQFELTNEIKVSRVIEGTIGRMGKNEGGIGPDAAPEAILAAYDRLGGGIKLDGDRVKRGCFFDFSKQKVFDKPEVILEFNINGKIVEVSADQPLPPLVRAAKEAAQGKVAEPEEEKEEDTDMPGEKTTRSKSTTHIGSGKKAGKKADESDE